MMTGGAMLALLGAAAQAQVAQAPRAQATRALPAPRRCSMAM